MDFLFDNINKQYSCIMYGEFILMFVFLKINSIWEKNHIIS